MKVITENLETCDKQEIIKQNSETTCKQSAMVGFEDTMEIFLKGVAKLSGQLHSTCQKPKPMEKEKSHVQLDKLANKLWASTSSLANSFYTHLTNRLGKVRFEMDEVLINNGNHKATYPTVPRATWPSSYKAHKPEKAD